MDRQITIQGTTVIAHAWEYQPKEERFDMKKHVESISSIFSKLAKQSDVFIVAVVGCSGSGKTMLAKVLESEGSNCEYIDCINLCSPLERDEIDFSSLFSDANKTYLLDAPEFLNDSVWSGVSKFTGNGGKVVCFVQDRADISHIKCEVYVLKRESA